MVHHIDDDNGPKVGRRGFMQIVGALGAAAATQPNPSTPSIPAPSPVAAPINLGPRVRATFILTPDEGSAAARYYPLRSIFEYGDYGEIASKFFGSQRYWKTKKWNKDRGKGVEEFLDKHMNDIIDLAREQYKRVVPEDEFSEEDFQQRVESDLNDLKELSYSVDNGDYEADTENSKIAKALIAMQEGEAFHHLFSQDVQIFAREDTYLENVLSEVRKILTRAGIPKELADQITIEISEDDDDMGDETLYEFHGPLNVLKLINDHFRGTGAEINSVFKDDGSEEFFEQPINLEDLDQKNIEQSLSTFSPPQAPSTFLPPQAPSTFLPLQEPQASPEQFNPVDRMMTSAKNLERQILEGLPNRTDKLANEMLASARDLERKILEEVPDRADKSASKLANEMLASASNLERQLSKEVPGQVGKLADRILTLAMNMERLLLKEIPDHTEKVGRLGRAASEALSDFFNDSLMRSRVHEYHREGKKDKPALELSQDLDLLFKQAATVPENPPLVYRLVDHGGEDLTGQVLEEPSYLSASASYEEAIERAKKTDQHVLALQVPQGTPILRRGGDVLLPRGTKMQVTEHDLEGGVALAAILKPPGGPTNV